MSVEQLDYSLLDAFNDEQTPADLAEIELFETDPDFIDPRCGSKSWKDLAEVVVALANYILTKSEWDESLMECTKQARDLHFIFNIEKLIECVTDAMEDSGDNVEREVFRQARRKKNKRLFEMMLSLRKQAG
ncbi:uncharacterized protein SETTUDRAFT_34181 [Exserohilum turcica Et28A]|uniref:Uncharacterized protein n=1 Tax=Exserohilum turcicum (strain 28A) TaxID=671987 RepID=R0IB94_EXST2|nr:uncharacterized protein SETTUDRAFT_34181 [Exserohilum turcica Et28A]EOA82635.1 hypothetical protein SETTUDRAFT_34181 [Exserohilum turcica Et28A]